MNVRFCEYFIAIAGSGTLSKAAQVLGVSQPTLSAFVSNAERQCGQPLFDRAGKTMTPTPAGQIYLNACRRMIEVKNRTYHSIALLSNACAEHFTVGVTPHRGSTVFSQAFRQFCRRWPNVRIDLKEGYMEQLRSWLDQGEIDLCLGTATEDDLEHYSFISHNREELLLCVPDYHPVAELAPTTPGQYATLDIHRLQDIPFVMWGEQSTNYRRVQDFMQRQSFIPTVVYQSNNMQLIDTMIASGAGAGFLPSPVCGAGQHRVYFSTDPPLYTLVGSFYPKNRPLTDAQRYFMYLVMRTQLANPGTRDPYFNEAATQIFNEFREVDDGYAPT